MTTRGKTLKENDYFRTSEFTLCCVIYYFGYSIEAMDKSIPNRAFFLFKRDAGLDELIQRYWSKTITVEPIAFASVIKEVKNRIYNN